jgi:endogenous inhibitor of DNA gyrase (YacG/DUF329 family)
MSSVYARRSPEEQRQARMQCKTTLICPTCGHESPAGTDGDWAITEAANDDGVRCVTHECPECWTSVVVQPRFEK